MLDVLMTAAPVARRGVLEVAVAAFIISILSLGWQVISWLMTQRPRLKVDLQLARATHQKRYLVAYDDVGTASAAPTAGSQRLSLLVRVLNKGVHPFEVTDVRFFPEKGTFRQGIGIAGIDQDPDPTTGIACSIPGVVAGHSQGLVWVYMDDLVEAFSPEDRILVSVGLGSGKTKQAGPVPMKDLLRADGRVPDDV